MRIGKSVGLLVLILLSDCTRKLSEQYMVNATRSEEKGNYKQAVNEYMKALSYRDPKTTEMCLLRVAFIYETYLKDYPKAINFYNELIRATQRPDLLFEAQSKIAQIEFEFLERYSEAINHFIKLLTHFPNSNKADQLQFQLAQAYLKTGQSQQARVEFQKLVRAYPNTKLRIKAELEAAKTFYTESDYPKAEEEIRSFIKRFPNETETGEAKFYLGHVLEENDDLKRAVTVYEDLLGSYPDQDLIQFKLDALRKRITVRGR